MGYGMVGGGWGWGVVGVGTVIFLTSIYVICIYNTYIVLCIAMYCYVLLYMREWGVSDGGLLRR